MHLKCTKSSLCIVISLLSFLLVRNKLGLTSDQDAIHASAATHAKVHVKFPKRANEAKYCADLQRRYFYTALHIDE